MTGPTAADPRLRGRTYAIPFDRVWNASVALVDGGLRGWSLSHADDQSGVLEAMRRTLLRKQGDQIVVDVGLDENAQTRVDLTCRRQEGGGSARRHARIVDRFCRALDRKLGAGAADILDPRAPRSWSTEGPA